MLYDTNWSIAVRTHARSHTYTFYVLAFDKKRRETLLDSNCASSRRKHYHRHRHRQRCCCCRMHCKQEDTCLPSLYFVLMRNVYTHNVYIENTHDSSGNGNHVLFHHHLSISLYSANGNGNSIECYTTRVRTLQIFPKSGEFSTFSLQHTHTHTHILCLHTLIPSNYIFHFSFSFGFFHSPYSFICDIHIHTHTYITGGTVHHR